MTAAPSRAIRRQAEKAIKTASRLIERGVSMLEKTMPSDEGDVIITAVERGRIAAAITDLETALQMEDASIRAHGVMFIDPAHRQQLERTIHEAKGFIEASSNLSKVLNVEGY